LGSREHHHHSRGTVLRVHAPTDDGFFGGIVKFTVVDHVIDHVIGGFRRGNFRRW
jgi:hypothetical protein